MKKLSFILLSLSNITFEANVESIEISKDHG